MPQLDESEESEEDKIKKITFHEVNNKFKEKIKTDLPDFFDMTLGHITNLTQTNRDDDMIESTAAASPIVVSPPNLRHSRSTAPSIPRDNMFGYGQTVSAPPIPVMPAVMPPPPRQVDPGITSIQEEADNNTPVEPYMPERESPDVPSYDTPPVPPPLPAKPPGLPPSSVTAAEGHQENAPARVGPPPPPPPPSGNIPLPPKVPVPPPIVQTSVPKSIVVEKSSLLEQIRSGVQKNKLTPVDRSQPAQRPNPSSSTTEPAKNDDAGFNTSLVDRLLKLRKDIDDSESDDWDEEDSE